MEPLCPNFDLLKSSSVPLFSHRLSSINRGISKRSSASFPCVSSYNRNCNHQASVKTEAPPQQQPTGPDLIKSLTKGFVGFAAAATALASVCSDSPAFAESLTVAFPVSRAQEVNTVQRTLVEAWGLIRETFVDPTFNHQDWDLKLQQTMVEMFPLKSADAAYGKIRGMLSTLGDPFTRIISPKEYQSFRIGSDGNLQGVGLFITVEPKTGHLIVLSCVEGSPAARAGIHDGDELIEINGQRLDGVDSEAAAQRLRGQAGTSVTVKLHRGNGSGSGSSIKEVKLPRELIRLSPISSTVIPHRTPDGRLTKTGYVKLSTFSQTAATEMKNTIHEMENLGVQSYILDLRNNPGGLVKVGLDVAKIWLDGNETLVNTVDRDGHMSPINMANGHALTHDPLVVLVNEGSASASEILAGALHDNGRAILVGHKTFGKGKIQSITELHDGSALFVTVAKYLSPALHDIDQVGITPDVQCTTEMLNSPKETLKGKRRSPPKAEKLVDFHTNVVKNAVAKYPGHSLILAGKSMGSRISCMVAGREDISPLLIVCLGYPLKGMNGAVRDETLLQLKVPVMFVQGTKDGLCPLEKLEAVRKKMKTMSGLHEIESGDHSFKISKKHLQTKGSTQEEAEDAAVQAIASFFTRSLR